MLSSESPDLGLVEVSMLREACCRDGGEEPSNGHKIPIIALAGTWDETINQPMGHFAAYCSLTKPVPPHRLKWTVDSVLNRLRLESQLKESEQNYKTLIDHSPDGIFVQVGERVVFANEAMARLLGLVSPEMLVGERVLDFVDPECRDVVRERMVRTLEHGEPVPLLEQKLIKNDGAVFHAEVSGAPVLYGGRRARQVIVRDITARKQAEEKLKRFEFMVEHSGQEAYLARPDGSLVYANPAASKSLGYTVEELKTLGVRGVDPTIGPTYRAHFQELKDNDVPPFETVHVDRYGRKIPKEIKSVYLRIGDNEYVCGFGMDITDRKLAEKKLKRSLEEKRVLLRELHHRVKNNLQVISSILRLQTNRIASEPCAAVLRDATSRVRAIAMLHEMLYDLEDFSRLEINGYIERLVKSLLSSYSPPNSEISVKLDIEAICFKLETAFPLGMVISELVTNALGHAFHSVDKGTLEVSLTTKDRNDFELAIRDNGVGIPGEVSWKDPRTLGLQLVKTFVEQLEGTLEMVTDGGTLARVCFKEVTSR